jgi:hypothetical protein
MVIVRGHKGLAEAYACHVLDLYDHYAFRFLLKAHPEIFGRPLTPDDTWQERYIIGPDEKSPELRFWLSAAQHGDTSSSGVLPPRKKPAKKKPAKKAAARKKSAAKKSKTKARKTVKKTTKKAAKKKVGKKKVAKKKAAKKKAAKKR